MNSGEFNTFLETLGAELKQSIEAIQQKISDAEDLNQKVQKYLEDSQGLIDSIHHEETGMSPTLQKAQSLATDISNLKRMPTPTLNQLLTI